MHMLGFWELDVFIMVGSFTLRDMDSIGRSIYIPTDIKLRSKE